MTRAYPGWKAILLAALVLPLAATDAHAYIGPGGAVSALGALLALVAAIFIALFGFLWFPIKRMLRKKREKKSGAEEGNESPAPGSEESDPR